MDLVVEVGGFVACVWGVYGFGFRLFFGSGCVGEARGGLGRFPGRLPGLNVAARRLTLRLSKSVREV